MEDNRDASALEQYPASLYDAVCRDAGAWVERRLLEIADGADVDVAAVTDAVTSTMRRELLDLLTQDVDAQRENPLHVLRRATRHATAALSAAGVPFAERDEFEQRAMPEDVYAFGPLTWRDLSENVHEAGITWGAWKAATVLSRRRAEGKDVP